MKTNFKIRQHYLLLLIFIGMISMTHAQQLAIKSNLAYWGTVTPNIGVEVGVNPKSTVELIGGLNIFTFSDNKKIKHWLLQPE